MISENITRKVDNLGRLTLPKHLRDKLMIDENTSLEIFTTSEEGRNFICISPKPLAEHKYVVAAEVLEELGYVVPEKLNSKAYPSPFQYKPETDPPLQGSAQARRKEFSK